MEKTNTPTLTHETAKPVATPKFEEHTTETITLPKSALQQQEPRHGQFFAPDYNQESLFLTSGNLAKSQYWPRFHGTSKSTLIDHLA